jgi:hypothetical protein
MGCQRGAEGLRADMSGREQAVAIHEEQEEEVDARADARADARDTCSWDSREAPKACALL